MSMGFYEYTGDDGKIYRVNYNSGKGGFMPMGDHIPTIPPQIKRALEYTARKEAERAAAKAALSHVAHVTPAPVVYEEQASPAPVSYEEEAAQPDTHEVPVLEHAGQEFIQRPALYGPQ